MFELVGNKPSWYIVGYLKPIPDVHTFVFPLLVRDDQPQSFFLSGLDDKQENLISIVSIEHAKWVRPQIVGSDSALKTYMPIYGCEVIDGKCHFGSSGPLAEFLKRILAEKTINDDVLEESINEFVVSVEQNNRHLDPEGLLLEAETVSAFSHFGEDRSFACVVKVIGIGDAGCNALDHMIREGVLGVDLVAANTDAQALKRSVAHKKILLGNTRFGASTTPEAGRSAAIDAREQIVGALRGAHMVFIIAGMGGGTGTGAAPIVAEIARELGILTVAVVTKPFGFEGMRLKVAKAGIAELQKNVDSLIVILNDKLMDVLGDDVSMDEAFKAADNVLHNAVGGIAAIINFPGMVNVDFEDVRIVMGDMGMAMMGSANASGVDRARLAAEQAVVSPLLEGINLSCAKGVLVSIKATRGLKMKEVNEVMNTVREFVADDAYIIFGAVYDESMGEEIRVTVVATGLGQAQAKRQSFEVINTPVMQATGTDGNFSQANSSGIDYGLLDALPAEVYKGRSATVEALAKSGVDRFDIPAFLRKQAD